MSGPNLTRDYGSLPPRSKVSDISAADMQDIASRGQARNMIDALRTFSACRLNAAMAERNENPDAARLFRADARAALDGHPELLAALGFDPRHVVLADIATWAPGQTVSGGTVDGGSLRLDFESGDAICVAADGALRWEAAR